MKAKFVKPLYKPKTDEKEILCKVDDVVEFSINNANKKAVLKISGKDIEMPFKVLFEKVLFTKDTKAELIALKMITADGKLVEVEPPKEQVAEKVAEEPASQQKSGAAATKQELAKGGAHGGLIGAIVNLNTICKGELLSLHVTKVSEASVDLSMVFFSSKFPAINATIDTCDFGTDKLEQEVAAFMAEHSATISNKLEVIAQLDDQIKARKDELSKPAATPAKPTAKPAAKKGANTATAEKVKEEPAMEFEEAEGDGDPEGDGDFEQPNVVDAEEFED